MAVEAPVQANLETKATQFIDRIMNLNPQDYKGREDNKAAVDTFGLELQREAAKSELLKQPVKKLSDRSSEGGEVANSLINLKLKVEELDPAKFNFEPSWVSRTLGFLPGIGDPLKKYFSKFESAQDVIAAIIMSLEKGRDQLTRDNITLTEDQKSMPEISDKLTQMITLSQVIDNKLQYKLDRELTAGSDQHKFLSEEILFPLRLIIAERANLEFIRNYGYAVGGILFFHFSFNIGMTMGLLPVVGIPLPFISKGGSSLMVFTIMVAVLLKMDMARFRSN